MGAAHLSSLSVGWNVSRVGPRSRRGRLPRLVGCARQLPAQLDFDGVFAAPGIRSRVEYHLFEGLPPPQILAPRVPSMKRKTFKLDEDNVTLPRGPEWFQLIASALHDREPVHPLDVLSVIGDDFGGVLVSHRHAVIRVDEIHVLRRVQIERLEHTRTVLAVNSAYTVRSPQPSSLASRSASLRSSPY